MTLSLQNSGLRSSPRHSPWKFLPPFRRRGWRRSADFAAGIGPSCSYCILIAQQTMARQGWLVVIASAVAQEHRACALQLQTHPQARPVPAEGQPHCCFQLSISMLSCHCSLLPFVPSASPVGSSAWCLAPARAQPGLPSRQQLVHRHPPWF